MIEFEIAGKTYQAGHLQLFDQMVVAKRVMPLIKNVLKPEIISELMAARMAAANTEGDAAAPPKIDLMKLLPALADAIHDLSDEDAERVMRTCLKVVQRKEGSSWASIISPGQVFVLCYSDIQLGQATQMVWKVIEDHLSDFFSIAR